MILALLAAAAWAACPEGSAPQKVEGPDGIAQICMREDGRRVGPASGQWQGQQWRGQYDEAGRPSGAWSSQDGRPQGGAQVVWRAPAAPIAPRPLPPEDPRQRWSIELPEPVVALALQGDQLLAQGRRLLSSVEVASGELVWSLSSGQAFQGRLRAEGGEALLLRGLGELTRAGPNGWMTVAIPRGYFDVIAAEGEQIWAQDGAGRLELREGPAALLRWRSSAAFLSGSAQRVGGLIIAEREGELRALDLQSGQQRWSRRLPAPLQRWAQVGELLVLVDQQGRVRALDPQLGALRWERRLPELRSPQLVAAPAGIFLWSPGGLLLLSPEDGASLAIPALTDLVALSERWWCQEQPDGLLRCGPVGQLPAWELPLRGLAQPPTLAGDLLLTAQGSRLTAWDLGLAQVLAEEEGAPLWAIAPAGEGQVVERELALWELGEEAGCTRGWLDLRGLGGAERPAWIGVPELERSWMDAEDDWRWTVQPEPQSLEAGWEQGWWVRWGPRVVLAASLDPADQPMVDSLLRCELEEGRFRGAVELEAELWRRFEGRVRMRRAAILEDEPEGGCLLDVYLNDELLGIYSSGEAGWMDLYLSLEDPTEAPLLDGPTGLPLGPQEGLGLETLWPGAAARETLSFPDGARLYLAPVAGEPHLYVEAGSLLLVDQPFVDARPIGDPGGRWWERWALPELKLPPGDWLPLWATDACAPLAP